MRMSVRVNKSIFFYAITHCSAPTNTQRMWQLFIGETERNTYDILISLKRIKKAYIGLYFEICNSAAVKLQHASRSSVLSMCRPCCWRTSVESGARFRSAEERAQERSLCPLPKVCTEQCGHSAVQKKHCSDTVFCHVCPTADQRVSWSAAGCQHLGTELMVQTGEESAVGLRTFLGHRYDTLLYNSICAEANEMLICS